MTERSLFPGRLALQQRLLPAYRAPFFDSLAVVCEGGLSVFAGQAESEEAVTTISALHVARLVIGRNYYFLPVSSPICLIWQSHLLRWLKEWDPAALIVEANPRYLSTHGAVSWMHARRRPVIGWGLGAPRSAVGFQRLLWQNFLKRFDALIAYSRRGAEEYRALGFPSERIFVASNAVAPRPKTPPLQRSAQFDERPNVLFVGRLQLRKRIDALLFACAALPQELQPRLWIIGDGPARQEFQTIAQEVYPRADFLGAKHGAELQSYFAAADLFVLPGTGGLAIQEAMAFALPVIVAEGDGTQNDLVRPENGWLVPSDDLAALKEALHSALADVQRLRRKGAESYRIVADEINLERMVAIFVEALQVGLKVQV
jgi:glycosyltransferase involved in cell wall biosynthesis